MAIKGDAERYAQISLADGQVAFIGADTAAVAEYLTKGGYLPEEVRVIEEHECAFQWIVNAYSSGS